MKDFFFYKSPMKDFYIAYIFLQMGPLSQQNSFVSLEALFSSGTKL